ncbi:potassium-transporting ATPase subunit KdpC [Cellvibrio sp. PSBB023]|uniref:potassium-transporting ATPase subunit KdpC n=1 Tax=Cellvibrio sp. PSBB023 TaxID=1945512 RepID=UPI00098F9FD2|nr:potassium-transporting ATPase subunit KdpC [Cellvibrio sp. PSBB023]AQT60311.1 potassium-transporting ATPase subunit C [Cellvibrio sp. PSBB023]
MNFSLSFSQQFFIGLRFCLVMLVLCGILYSASITKLGELLFSYQAQGSLLEHKGEARGSLLVAQTFSGDGYFHGRPSAASNDPMATAGSNLAPSNPALRERALTDSTAIQIREQITATQIPVDLISASGSGVDPHISPAAAQVQIARVARARNISEAEVVQLVANNTEQKQWGIFGQVRVNVLLLNLALDQLAPH